MLTSALILPAPVSLPERYLKHSGLCRVVELSALPCALSEETMAIPGKAGTGGRSNL